MAGPRTTKSRTAFYYREPRHQRPSVSMPRHAHPGQLYEVSFTRSVLRGQFYNRRTERLGPVIIEIQRKREFAGKIHRFPDQLCATGAGIGPAGVTHGGSGKINRTTQILSCPAVERK